MLRLTRGVSRSNISQMTGITVSSIGNYERGDKIPGADSLKSLCDYFQVSADYLLGRTDMEKDASQWPSAVPIGAVPGVESIKYSVESMLSSVCLSAFGLYIIECYAEIIELLTEIDSFASKKLHSLQIDYPDFQQFGSENRCSLMGYLS
jgi:transcriptional regulator with XRE-family HTH domain